MIGIKINDNLLLKEKGCSIDRTVNELYLTFEIVPIFGAQLTKKLSMQSRALDFAINKIDNPDLWLELKCLDNEVLIRFANTKIAEWKELQSAKQPEIFYTAITDPIQGKVSVASVEKPTDDWKRKETLSQEFPGLTVVNYEINTLEVIEI